MVYSTCSIHREEDEDVVKAALDSDVGKSYELVNIFPNSWAHRGLSLFPRSEYCLRTSPISDSTQGFFVACFQRRSPRDATVTTEVTHTAPPKQEAGDELDTYNQRVTTKGSASRKRKKK